MGLFDIFKKKETKLDFLQIDSAEKAMSLAEKGLLSPLYLMPLRFNGEESISNRVFVPSIIVELKDRYDDMVEDLLVEGKVDGYSCKVEYKEKSCIPSKLNIIAKMDGKPVFSQTIKVW